MSLTVSAASGGGGSGGGGTILDSDGDGFSDAIEIAAGSNPNDANSFPLVGGSPGGGGTTLLLPDVKLGIKLNFDKKGGDSIALSGTVIVPSGFTASGAGVTVNIGGVTTIFTLDSKGSAKSGDNSLKLALKGTGSTAKFSMKLNKGDYTASLADEGLVGTADAKDAPVQVTVTLSFGGLNYQKIQSQLYSAKAKKSGITKDKKQ